MSATIDLVGDRVRLRTTVAADTERLLAIRSSPVVQEWWRGDDIAAELEENLDDDETCQLSIEVRGEVVGLIQFGEEEDPEYRHASVDIYLDPVVHRQGIATEAIGIMVRHLFGERGHHRITIDPAAANTAAIACYSRFGFRTVGTMRSYEQRSDGTWADGLLMELLAEDFAG